MGALTSAIRPAAVAGMFYPGASVELGRDILAMLEETRAAPLVPGLPKGLIVPHAGYIYSGAVAANAYAADVSARYARATTPDEEAAILAEADALNGALIDARRIITPWTLGEGGLMGSWDVFLRSDQHAHDYGFVSSAITALHRNRIGSALVALEGVYTMEWGRHFSRHTYLTLFDGMVNTYMYWGDDFDQQQAYVDVQGIYLGLKDGSVSKAAALADLTWIRDAQLLPWFQEDLRTLVWAWSRAAAVLDAALP